jgi:hypothetical protein
MMIRPQYHFRMSGQQLLAWDVARLINLSKDFPVREIAVERITEFEENHWYAHGNVAPTCRSISEHCKLIFEADISCPIILDASGRVMDGMHRVCKARLKDMPTIRSVRFTQDPEPDYVGYDPDSLPYRDK